METSPSLAETLFGRKPDGHGEIWQDREIRFDVARGELACRRGEEVLDYMVRPRAVLCCVFEFSQCVCVLCALLHASFETSAGRQELLRWIAGMHDTSNVRTLQGGALLQCPSTPHLAPPHPTHVLNHRRM